MSHFLLVMSHPALTVGHRLETCSDRRLDHVDNVGARQPDANFDEMASTRAAGQVEISDDCLETCVLVLSII